MAGVDRFPDGEGDLVGVDGGEVGGVEDGPDADVRVGVGEPTPELLEGDGSVGGAEDAAQGASATVVHHFDAARCEFIA